MAKKGQAIPKRHNKTKEEIATQLVSTAKVERMKVLARLIWPFIQDQKSIYDAQTALNAAAGYIKQELNAKATQIIVKELPIDLKDEKASLIKTAVENLIGLLQTEKADDAAALLERMGNSLGQFAAAKYMKEPMSAVSMDEFIA